MQELSIEELVAGRRPAEGKWTTLADWYRDDQALVGVATQTGAAAGMKLLAYGLERLDGRQLHLALPPLAVDGTRHRAAFLQADVSVYRRTAGGAVLHPPASRDEALAGYRELGGPTQAPDAESFDGPSWLLDLIDWLESRRVERVRRSAYWGWHYRGRQVLRLSRTMSAWTFIAGVNYSKATGDQPEPLKVVVADEAPLTSDHREQIRQAVDQAIERRREGEDDGHREHLLQAALADAPGLIGMAKLVREVPAWRPPSLPKSRRGFIDFLGVDVDGGLHVIETKIGPDAMLGLQGLDYWAWATEHRKVLALHVGADSEVDAVGLNYVLAAGPKQLLHEAARSTLSCIEGAISWRCHVLEDWDTVGTPRRLLQPHAIAGLRASTVPDETSSGSPSA